MTAEEIFAVQSHRPFPLPRSPWVIRQEWHNLLFAHWTVPVDVVRRLVPAQLELDLWEGLAYIGVVPFLLRNMRARGTLALPVLSRFAEINVRTYVRYKGVPGVYFFSLDAANLSAVVAARFFYALPYFQAAFQVRSDADRVEYESKRIQRPRPADFCGSYLPISEVMNWRDPLESVERFLSERYCLYAVTRRKVYRTHVHHLPWPLQKASAEISVNTMTAPLQVELSGPPLLHFSKSMDVLTWWPEQAD